MSKISRRRFLEQAVVGVVGVSTFAPLAGKQISVESFLKGGAYNQEDSGDDFIQGVVVDVDVNSGVFKSKDDRRSHVVQVTPDTYLWKGKVTTLADVQLGDFLYGIGTPTEDGMIFAEKLWFNIVSFYAQVDSILEKAPDKVRLHVIPAGGGRETPFIVVKDKDTIVNSESPSDSYDPEVGHTFQVIGLALRDGSFKATRIWTMQ